MSERPHGLLLPSFWMGGYEGADHVNAAGEALDMVRATGHLDRLEEDYRRAARQGLRCLRESIGWRLSEGAGGAMDLSRAVRMASTARRAGIQPLWTLMHYGLPPDLSLFDDAIIERFARFAGAVARTLRPLCPAPRFYTPINEISFLAWAASTGGFLWQPDDAPATEGGPGSERSGYLVKRRLARAALAGMAAIRKEDPQARFLHVEPLVHVAPPLDRPDLAPLAQQIRDYQWQALDLLGGRLEPELGGHEGALDWLGFNHYHSSQWEAQTERRLAWHLRDPRRQPLGTLLQEAWLRYRRPLLIAETGHVGMGRSAWLHDVAGEALRARALGLPLQGVCLYPLLDRPDWYEPRRWHRCGLWHLGGERRQAPGPAADARLPVQAYARALQAWQCLPAEPPGCARRLLVLLPGRWEALDAGLQHLLRRLCGERLHGARGPRAGASFSVLLVEPPRPHEGPPQLRRHRLGPGLELIMLHTAQAAHGWATAGQDLTLLRSALGPDPGGGTLTWLMRWPATQPLPLEALPRGALLLQPDAQALPPPASPAWPGLPARPALLLCEAPQQARRWAARCEGGGTRVLRLPLGLPERALRPPPPGTYEAEEVGALLGPAPGPRLLVCARPQQPLDLVWLDALARLRPHWQFLMLGSHAPSDGRWPSACRGLGELAPELLPALLHACDAGLVLAPVSVCTTHLWPELLHLAPCIGLPVISTPLAELMPPAPQGGRPGWRIAPDAAAMVRHVEALLGQPRHRPSRRALAEAARRQHRLERDLLQALAGLAAASPAQEDRGPAAARPEAITAGSALAP